MNLLARPKPEAVAYVAGLPRRTAHALHGLLEWCHNNPNMPPSAAEAQLYDGEAITARQTAAGLRHAQRLGLCVYARPWWVATNAAHTLRGALEARYMEETADA